MWISSCLLVSIDERIWRELSCGYNHANEIPSLTKPLQIVVCLPPS